MPRNEHTGRSSPQIDTRVAIRSSDRFPSDSPHIIAHRASGRLIPGEYRRAPENTPEALEAARELGYRTAEIDVTANVCANEEPTLFVLHSDDPLEETTDGEGDPFNKSWEYLHSLDVGSRLSPEFAGVRIPTLDEMEQVADRSRITLIKEVKVPRKPNKPEDFDVDISREIGRLIANRERALSERFKTKSKLFLSFSAAALRKISQVAPEIPLGINISYDQREMLEEDAFPDLVDYLRSLGCSYVDPDQRLVTERFVQRAKEKGLVVLTYFGKDKGDIKEVTRVQEIVQYGASPIIDPIHLIRPIYDSAAA